MLWTISSCALGVIPLAVIPSRSRRSMCFIRSTLRLLPMARRSSSASPPVKFAAVIAIRISCSWKRGTPRVRSSTGQSEGCGTEGFWRPARRSRYGVTICPTMGPGRMVAIIRPGPIVGQMVNPYLERRAGRQKPSVPHPSLWPVLERTLGVPLFQEQLMRIAMTAANFTGGEADELRRAMGSKRSVERMKHIEQRLREGMTANGITPKAQDEIVQSITSFALYGFPESHAASFALIVYASAYLKVHHPQAFYAAMLNCWPMGFYSPATLVKDAQRRGVRVKPIDVARSEWLCTLEREGPEEELRLRLGLRYVRGLREEMAKKLAAERSARPFASIADLSARVSLRREELATLAEIGALASLPVHPGSSPGTRRAASWQCEAALRRPPGLFAQIEPLDEPDPGPKDERGDAEARRFNSFLKSKPPRLRVSALISESSIASPLPEMTVRERTAADLRGTGMTVGPHPVALERERLRRLGVRSAAELPRMRNGQRVRAGGQIGRASCRE